MNFFEPTHLPLRALNKKKISIQEKVLFFIILTKKSLVFSSKKNKKFINEY